MLSFVHFLIKHQMRNLTKEEFVHILRRQSTGFARGSSKYRGVTLHKCGRWEARMGQLLGKKYTFFHFFTFIFSIFSSMLGARIQLATRNLEKVNLLEHIKWYTIVLYWLVIAVVLVKGILGRDKLAMLKSVGIFLFSILNSVNNIIYLLYIFYN